MLKGIKAFGGHIAATRRGRALIAIGGAVAIAIFVACGQLGEAGSERGALVDASGVWHPAGALGADGHPGRDGSLAVELGLVGSLASRVMPAGTDAPATGDAGAQPAALRAVVAGASDTLPRPSAAALPSSISAPVAGSGGLASAGAAPSTPARRGPSQDPAPAASSAGAAAAPARGRWVDEVSHEEDVYEDRPVKVGTTRVLDREAWDEPVYDTRPVIHCSDGFVCGTNEERIAHVQAAGRGTSISYYVDTETYVSGYIHHDEVSHEEDVYEARPVLVGTRTVVDVPGHWE